MEFEYLDNESEDLLRILMNKDYRENIQGHAMKYLVENKYVRGIDATTMSDLEPCFIFTGVCQKGKSYFEMKNKYEIEQKKLSHREWKIAIISAVIGAIIGLIPTIIQFIFKLL